MELQRGARHLRVTAGKDCGDWRRFLGCLEGAARRPQETAISFHLQLAAHRFDLGQLWTPVAR